MRQRPLAAANPTPEIDDMVKTLGTALEEYQIQPNSANLQYCRFLEKQIQQARIHHQRKMLLQFLDKLESKHQVSKMRAFYQEVKKRLIHQVTLHM